MIDCVCIPPHHNNCKSITGASADQTTIKPCCIVTSEACRISRLGPTIGSLKDKNYNTDSSKGANNYHFELEIMILKVVVDSNSKL